MSDLSKPFNITSHKVDETISELGKMPFGSLIGNILSACVDAQNDAAITAWNYTQEVLRQKDPVVFTFQEAGTLKKLSVPLVTIVPLPYLKLDNIDINFDAEVSVNNERSNDFLVKVNNNNLEGNSVHLAKGESNLHIDINAGTTDMPAGLALLMNYMGGGLVIEELPSSFVDRTDIGDVVNSLTRPRPINTTRPARPISQHRPSSPTGRKGSGSGSADVKNLMNNLQSNAMFLAEMNRRKAEEERRRRLEEQRIRKEEMRREDEERRLREEEDRRREEEHMRMMEEQTRMEEEERSRRDEEERLMQQEEERRRQEEEEQHRREEDERRRQEGDITVDYFRLTGNTIDNEGNYIGAPLRGLHVNWTRPTMMTPGTADYRMDDLDVISTILSALLWRKFNGPIKLYTDSAGYQYYDSLGMMNLWNGGVDTETLENIPQNIPADIFWAAGKIFAIANEGVPFVMMDTDLMVWQSLNPLVGQNPVMAFHPETLNDYNSCYLSFDLLKKPPRYSLDPRWDWNQNPVNTALTYFADSREAVDFKAYYTTSAIRFMRNNTERPMEMVSQMVFAEQRLFAMCAKMNFGGVPTFLTSADEQGRPFTHIWGNKAAARDNPAINQQLCNQLVQIIGTHFSDIPVSPQVQQIFDKYR